MDKILEKNVIGQLEEIQKSLKPKVSVMFTTVMCDCTGWCYGNCQGDCQASCEGDKR